MTTRSCSTLRTRLGCLDQVQDALLPVQGPDKQNLRPAAAWATIVGLICWPGLKIVGVNALIMHFNFAGRKSGSHREVSQVRADRQYPAALRLSQSNVSAVPPRHRGCCWFARQNDIRAVDGRQQPNPAPLRSPDGRRGPGREVLVDNVGLETRYRRGHQRHKQWNEFLPGTETRRPEGNKVLYRHADVGIADFRGKREKPEFMSTVIRCA